MVSRKDKNSTIPTFHDKAIRIIKKIPHGKVATYGQIAAYAGNPRGARQVVWILNSCWHKYNLPWHRVINSRGRISLKRGAGFETQKKLLQKEGVKFARDNSLDLDKYQWLPRML